MYCKYQEQYSYKMTPGVKEFMERMNFKASQIGMTSSSFVNPYGGAAFGYNSTNCIDLLRLGIHAYSYPYVMDVITTRYGADFHIYGEHDRDVHLEHDYQADFDKAYEAVHPGSKNPYVIYGGKGGGWSTGEHKVFAYMAYCRVGEKNIIAVVSNVSADRTIGRTYRRYAIIEILDICQRILAGESKEQYTLKYADYGAAALLPTETLSVLLKQRPINMIFAQNPEVCFNPASITKVLMAITAMDICGGNQEMYMIQEEDIANDSTYLAFPGDIESIEIGLYPILVSSNGSNTMALARHCGEKILEEKRKFNLSNISE